MVDRLANTEANRVRVETVEHAFGISGSKLLIPGRVLVGEGVLTKICRKRPKPRQFFLFNDIMVYGNILINKKKYNKQHIIPLEGVTLEDLKDEENVQNNNGWLIKTPHKSFAVFAATQTEKVEWMAHIEKCIRDLITRTGRAPSTGHAAVWIPDTEVKKCMHCQKTLFTMINRRHHCRNCGNVICGNCSKNKFLIPSQSKTPVRVCDTCFEDLGTARTNYNVPKNDTESETPSAADTWETSPIVNGPTSGDAFSANRGMSDTEESSDEEDGSKTVDHLNEKVESLEIDRKPQFYDENVSSEEEKTNEGNQLEAKPVKNLESNINRD